MMLKTSMCLSTRRFRCICSDTIQKLLTLRLCAVTPILSIPSGKAKLLSKIRAIPAARALCCFSITTRSWDRSIIEKLFSTAGLTLVRDERQQTDWIASGKFPIAITAKAGPS